MREARAARDQGGGLAFTLMAAFAGPSSGKMEAL
jgi:hypothetical protein